MEKELIPGLHNELVRDNILPRLPWYVRPVASVLSTTWKLCIEEEKLTAAYQVPALQGTIVMWKEGLFKILDGDVWKALPPLPHPKRELLCFVASRGKIIVWNDPLFYDDAAYKLDLGKSLFKWEPVRVLSSEFPDHAVAFQGKVFCFDMLKENVQVYDTEKDAFVEDECEFSSMFATDSNNLYGLIAKPQSSLDIMAFQPSRNAWELVRTIDLNGFKWSYDITHKSIMVVEGEFFGLQISKLIILKYVPGSNEWVAVKNCTPPGSVDVCEVLPWHGFMYARTRTPKLLWKGRVNLAENSIDWEEIQGSSGVKLFGFMT